jgi:hypothetical protein
MLSAKPGMRCGSISESTYRSMAARSGSSAAAEVDMSNADAMPQATATRSGGQCRGLHWLCVRSAGTGEQVTALQFRTASVRNRAAVALYFCLSVGS